MSVPADASAEDAPYFTTEARALAADVAQVKGTPLIALSGPLGAGKTTLTKALLSEWGYDASKVQSPTFLHLFEYPTPHKGLVLHMDCYRMQEDFDWDRLALESYAEAGAWIVEWPEPFLKVLKEHEALRRLLGFQSVIEVQIAPDRSLNVKRRTL